MSHYAEVERLWACERDIRELEKQRQALLDQRLALLAAITSGHDIHDEGAAARHALAWQQLPADAWHPCWPCPLQPSYFTA
jgi:hypothetical protein